MSRQASLLKRCKGKVIPLQIAVNDGTVINNPAAIVRAVGRIDCRDITVMNSAAVELINLALFVLDCQIRAGHDEILSAFEGKAKCIDRCGFLGKIDLEPLREHIEAQRAWHNPRSNPADDAGAADA